MCDGSRHASVKPLIPLLPPHTRRPYLITVSRMQLIQQPLIQGLCEYEEKKTFQISQL